MHLIVDYADEEEDDHCHYCKVVGVHGHVHVDEIGAGVDVDVDADDSAEEHRLGSAANCLEGREFDEAF